MYIQFKKVLKMQYRVLNPSNPPLGTPVFYTVLRELK